mmetsp:Transcript_20613/g.59710  ORF Transcript_20613/g.59710 Transcript_20613/m.59710 type:complete len:229 (-) Transcript_20613:210-896(-)
MMVAECPGPGPAKTRRTWGANGRGSPGAPPQGPARAPTHARSSTRSGPGARRPGARGLPATAPAAGRAARSRAPTCARQRCPRRASSPASPGGQQSSCASAARRPRPCSCRASWGGAAGGPDCLERPWQDRRLAPAASALPPHRGTCKVWLAAAEKALARLRHRLQHSPHLPLVHAGWPWRVVLSGRATVSARDSQWTPAGLVGQRPLACRLLPGPVRLQVEVPRMGC